MAELVELGPLEHALVCHCLSVPLMGLLYLVQSECQEDLSESLL